MFRADLCMLPLFLSFVSCSVFAKTTSQPEKIKWLLNDAPPFFIMSGEHQQKGICDVTLTWVKKALSDIEHEDLVLPHTRLGRFMDDGAKACFPCMIKRDQASARAVYSNPTVIYPPHVLVTTNDFLKEQAITRDKPVSLKALLETKNYIFAKHGGRRFGTVLDELLSQYSDEADELILRNEGKSTTSILDMLRLGRGDISIEYPAIVNYYNSSHEENLQTIEMLENRNTPVAGAIGCATSAADDFAANALEAINKVLPEIVSDEDYQKQVSQWFSQDETYYNWYQTLVVTSSQQ